VSSQIVIAERLKIYAELASSSDAAIHASFMVSVVKSDVSSTLLVVVLWLSGTYGVPKTPCPARQQHKRHRVARTPGYSQV
jgi:hypothetical protein